MTIILVQHFHASHCLESEFPPDKVSGMMKPGNKNEEKFMFIKGFEIMPSMSILQGRGGL